MPGTYPVSAYGASVETVIDGDAITNVQAATGADGDRLVVERVDRRRGVVEGSVRFHTRHAWGHPSRGFVDERVSVFEGQFVAHVRPDVPAEMFGPPSAP